MKRLVLTLAVLLAAATSPVTVDLAQARDQGARAEPRGRGPERNAGVSRRYDGPRWRDEGRGPDRRWQGRGAERWDEPPRGRAYGAPYPYPPPGYGRPLVRPGGRLPYAYRDAMVYEYQRFRLRPPPHGYAWFRAPGAFLLVSLADGQIFDVIPD